MKKASLITDGSCLGNPGPGGWACILRFGAIKKELFGYDAHTTNNRMESMVAIQGLLAFKEPTPPTKITTVAIGLPKMPARRRPVRGPTARRTGASGSTWAATTSIRSRRPACSTLSILAKTMKTRATRTSG